MSVNNQNFYQMKIPINAMGRQSTGIDNVLNLDTDYVSVAQQKSGIRGVVNGAIASFQTNIVAPLLKCIAGIEPVQEGTGDPSPENVRPITGWRRCNIVRTGKNFLPLPNVELGKPGNRTISIPISIPLKPGEYKLAFSKSGTPDLLFGANFFKTGTTSEQVGNTNINTGMVTITKSPTSLYIYMRQADYDEDKTLVLTDIQLVLPDESNEYEAYTGQIYTINFPTPPGTVYGGTLDVVTGLLTVDRALVTLDGSQTISDNGVMTYGGIQAIFTPSPAKKYADSSSHQNEGLMSDKFSTNDPAPHAPSQMTGRATNEKIYMNMPSNVTTAAEARTWFTNNPTQVSYLLATPVTYQLTPTEINTLIGENNIWADTGNISIEYLEVADL